MKEETKAQKLQRLSELGLVTDLHRLRTDRAQPGAEVLVREPDLLRAAARLFGWRKPTADRVRGLGSSDWDRLVLRLAGLGYRTTP